MSTSTAKTPNILIILTDQQRYPTVYETPELARFRREELPAQQSLRDSGISFDRHYVMSAACAPSRTSLITGQYSSLHRVTQTDGIAKSADGGEMIFLAPDTVPTIGDWFRAGGYRTFYKGKWHVSHSHLKGADGRGYLQTLDADGNKDAANTAAYLEADLLDEYGFSEWVGPEAHGLGYQNTGTARDPFTADEAIALLKRLDQDGNPQPWLTVCSFLNPHDIALFGVIGLANGLRFNSDSVPSVPNAPTHDEDLSTKPDCQQSYIDAWKNILMPQPWIEAQRQYYYELHRTVDKQIGRVLTALRETGNHENTIVVFTSDHGDMLGAHGGMHQKWHNAYEETVHVPFVVSSPLFPGGRREADIPSSHADLLPTLLGLASINPAEALQKVASTHKEARPLVGRDLSALVRGTGERPKSEPVLFITDDEISEGSESPASPLGRLSKKLGRYSEVVQPNHIESVVATLDVDGEEHLVKLTRYHDNPQFWTVPNVRDDRARRGKKVESVTAPEPDQYELYDLAVDPLEQHNLAHPKHANDHTRALKARMLEILIEQVAAKRILPSSGVTPGYRPPRTD